MVFNVTIFWPLWLGLQPLLDAIKSEIDSLDSTEIHLMFVLLTLTDDENVMVVNECTKLLQLTWPDCDQIISAKNEVRTLLCSRNITDCPCIEITTKDTSTKQIVLSTSSLAMPDEDAPTLFAHAMEAYERFDLTAAATNLWNASRKDPQHKSAFFNLAGILHMVEYPTLAVHYVECVLCLDPTDMIAHSFLWALTQSKEASAVGVAAYRRLASAGDCLAASKLAALTGEGSLAARGDPSYARRIYDDMAETFETKLCARLGYRGPWDLLAMVEEVLATEPSSSSSSSSSSSVAAAVAAVAAVAAATTTTLPPKGQWRVLDLGCGSGLCGKVFAAFVAPVDPAPAATTPDGNAGAAVLQATTPGVIDSVRVELSALIDLSHGGSGSSSSSSSSSSFMAGVDVSLRMVNIAAATGYYHAVSRGDLLDALAVFATPDGGNNDSNQLPDATVSLPDATVRVNGDDNDTRACPSSGCLLHLILAADTFIYVGALGAVFALARRCLAPSGLLVFSIEDLDASPMRMRMTAVERPPSTSTLPPSPTLPSPLHAADNNAVINPLPAPEVEWVDGEPVGAVPGWGAQLLSSARFAHSHAYIQLHAKGHGYTIKACREVVLRTEETVPLQGRMYVLELL